MSGVRRSRSSLLPLLVLVSLLAILVPWLVSRQGEEGGGSNVPPDPYLQRLDARAGLEAMPPAETGAPDLGRLLEQLTPQEDTPAQSPLPTVRLWLLQVGPFETREAAEAERETMVALGIPAALEEAETGAPPWFLLAGPYSDRRLAAGDEARLEARLQGAVRLLALEELPH